eukprot:TRINITY_DN3552_c0_g1_i3.p1 TRINITY_DN3552_c0_g1~~TRINITY_DN3552_c0_g1_i3.p1  ORF type:complete len:228 (-),score=42.74 TRINITY_DN3552_c0_g1_i3:22-705(-)
MCIRDRELKARAADLLSIKTLTTAHIELDGIERELKEEFHVPSTEYDNEIWRKAREMAYKRAEEMVLKCDLVVVDDNFYYESMRKPYFRLCQKRSIGFLGIFLDIDASKAKEQNSLREQNKVKENVISRMEEKFEAPEINENILIIKHWDSAVWNKVKYHLNYSLANPLKDTIKEVEEAKEKSREITSKSLIHSIDMAIRQEVNLSLIHICRCRRYAVCRSRWSPYH